MITRRPSATVLQVVGGALVGAVVISVGAADAQERSIERLFYYVDREDSYESLTERIHQISMLAPGGFSVDENGIVWGEIDPRVLELAREHDVPVTPLIVNPGFDQEMLSELLADSTARARAVGSMVELCRRYGFDRIQFDFENLHVSDRDAYTRFFREAADALHQAECHISVAVVHRPEVSPGPTR